MKRVDTGVYIHIPFCRNKCAYCDFYSVTNLSLIHDFVDALKRELTMRTETTSPSPVRSLYFGGGTPSVLSVDAVEAILSTVSEYWKIGKNTEITFEINPGTVDRFYLDQLQKIGINRLSIGVQSFDNETLAFLGRIHDAEQAVKTIEFAHEAGFQNIGADIIYGISPGKSTIWETDLAQAVKLPITHISAYMLTLEPGTPLYRRWETSPNMLADQKTKIKLFEQVSALLENKGFTHYEVSNFARRKDYYSVHNQGYWDGSPYLGFGPSAHSFSITRDKNHVRSWNRGNTQEYIAEINKGCLPVEETEILTTRQIMMEEIMVKLRTRKGINLTKFYETFGRDFETLFASLIQDLVSRKWAGIYTENTCDTCHQYFHLTTKGWTFLDHIVETFISRF